MILKKFFLTLVLLSLLVPLFVSADNFDFNSDGVKKLGDAGLGDGDSLFVSLDVSNNLLTFYDRLGYVGEVGLGSYSADYVFNYGVRESSDSNELLWFCSQSPLTVCRLDPFSESISQDVVSNTSFISSGRSNFFLLGASPFYYFMTYIKNGRVGLLIYDRTQDTYSLYDYNNYDLFNPSSSDVNYRGFFSYPIVYDGVDAVIFGGSGDNGVGDSVFSVYRVKADSLSYSLIYKVFYYGSSSHFINVNSLFKDYGVDSNSSTIGSLLVNYNHDNADTFFIDLPSFSVLRPFSSSLPDSSTVVYPDFYDYSFNDFGDSYELFYYDNFLKVFKGSSELLNISYSYGSSSYNNLLLLLNGVLVYEDDFSSGLFHFLDLDTVGNGSSVVFVSNTSVDSVGGVFYNLVKKNFLVTKDYFIVGDDSFPDRVLYVNKLDGSVADSFSLGSYDRDLLFDGGAVPVSDDIKSNNVFWFCDNDIIICEYDFNSHSLIEHNVSSLVINKGVGAVDSDSDGFLDLNKRVLMVTPDYIVFDEDNILAYPFNYTLRVVNRDLSGVVNSYSSSPFNIDKLNNVKGFGISQDAYKSGNDYYFAYFKDDYNSGTGDVSLVLGTALLSSAGVLSFPYQSSPIWDYNSPYNNLVRTNNFYLDKNNQEFFVNFDADLIERRKPLSYDLFSGSVITVNNFSVNGLVVNNPDFVGFDGLNRFVQDSSIALFGDGNVLFYNDSAFDCSSPAVVGNNIICDNLFFTFGLLNVPNNPYVADYSFSKDVVLINEPVYISIVGGNIGVNDIITYGVQCGDSAFVQQQTEINSFVCSFNSSGVKNVHLFISDSYLVDGWDDEVVVPVTVQNQVFSGGSFTVLVLDESQSAIQGASVVLGDTTVLTNDLGEAFFSVPQVNNTYQLLVSKPSYLSNSVNVISNGGVYPVIMIPSGSGVGGVGVLTVKLFDSSNNPVSDAVCSYIDSVSYVYDTGFTNDDGVVYFSDVPVSDLVVICDKDDLSASKDFSFTDENNIVVLSFPVSEFSNSLSLDRGCVDDGVWLCGDAKIVETSCSSDADCPLTNFCVKGLNTCSRFNYSKCDEFGLPRNDQCVRSLSAKSWLSRFSSWFFDNLLYVVVILIVLVALAMIKFINK